LDADRPPFAVLVQQLVPADVSGVLFSADPVTGARDVILINASWGLGESIVGGTVTPDTYRVDKETLTIRAREIGTKQRMTVRIADGTEEVDVPRVLRGVPALNDEQIVQAAGLARTLEEDMGWPVDVECAFRGRSMYLLQCRPITSL
jgi:pyruvate,water dikinase